MVSNDPDPNVKIPKLEFQIGYRWVPSTAKILEVGRTKEI